MTTQTSEPPLQSSDETLHPALEAPVLESLERGHRIDKVVFGISAALAVGFVLWGLLDTGGLGAASGSALDWTV